MPKRTNNKKKITKTTKRKSCRRTNKTTGVGTLALTYAGGALANAAPTVIPVVLQTAGAAGAVGATAAAWGTIKGLLGAVGGTILSAIPNVIATLGNIGTATLSAAAIAAGFVGPPLWDGIKFLSKTGFKSLYHFLVDFWRDESSDTIPTDNIKAIIVDIKKQLIHKNPELKNDPIMEDLSELNKLCFIIDSMNEEGLTAQQYDELKQKLTDDLKYIFHQFRTIMNS